MTDINTLHTIRRFRSAPVAMEFASSKINAEAGIIEDVVMIQEGEAKGHEVHIDSEFITKLVAYDQAQYGDRGVKVRFGHPSASDETMGKQMGFMRNVRTRRHQGKMQAIADLHLLTSADSSPNTPNMREWVLSMAAEAPDFIMSSIVFMGSGFYQKKKNGHKQPVASRYEMDPDLGPVYIEFDPENGAEHYYTDLVEQGAATENMFSNKVNPDFFVSRVHEWLDFHPEILDFAKQNPEKVQAFLKRIGIGDRDPQPQLKMSKFSLTDWLLGKDTEQEPGQDDLATIKTELETAKAAVIELRQERDAFEQKFKDAQAEAERLQAETAKLKADAEELRTSLTALEERLKKLEASPAGEATGGDGGNTPQPETKRAYEQNPLTQRARKYYRPNDQD